MEGEKKKKHTFLVGLMTRGVSLYREIFLVGPPLIFLGFFLFNLFVLFLDEAVS